MSNNYEIFKVPTTPNLEVFYSQAKNDYKGCILCIPGVCHGAWCFENFLSYFADNGYDCYALSLRGHAGSEGYEKLNKYGLLEYSNDVKRCIEYCKSTECEYKMKSDPFLLGHSMGGAVVQKYIGEYSNTIKGAILFASATAGGMDFKKTMKDSATHKNLFLSNLVGLGFCKTMRISSIYKSAFFDRRITKENAKLYKKKLCRESRKILFSDLYEEYTSNTDIDIPILVIGSYADSYFPQESLIKTAKVFRCSEKDTRKHLEILPDLCHDMMLDEVEEGWKKSAKKVLEFIENNK